MKKEIWIFQTGEPTHLDDEKLRPMRSMNLANALVEAGHKVCIWAAMFDHTNKIFRELPEYEPIIISDNLSYRFIPSPGYSSNISLRRLYDHIILKLRLTS